MLSSILLGGLLTASTFASPIEIPAALQPRGERKYCDGAVVNADPPDEYCYQFCDLEMNRRVSDKPVVVSETSFCSNGPDGGCPITILNQVGIEVSSTETRGTTDTVTVDTGVTIFGAHLGASFSHWVESSHATTHGTTTTKAATNWLYIPKGKSGHVVFFPFYEEHCGPATALRKPNLQDEEEFNCNPDYNLLINHDAKLDRLRGMQYDWDGIDEGDIYNYTDKTCIRLPMTEVNGNARGQYQVCDSDNTDNRCKECVGCDANA
ncbi:hypothetical protein V495_05440 [Pseudogymnoascus sp. VKM F-4514 (FW-929)]|nr:hypothetical protein V490_06479 [Pseudogymnoascus sp. VKM F-3557]KFY40420.1 hypothetical protein V495_05440 [Pseudogymnoascus sp. VKM F-4514 (FW-929)]KFY60088.1 hypothetical protein V497_03862 [Pseudogymnoascus sp. VKM F-4516 (FW-969)]